MVADGIGDAARRRAFVRFAGDNKDEAIAFGNIVK